MKIQIPDKIKIGGIEWKIKEDDTATSDEGRFGKPNFRTQTICLDPSTTEQYNGLTLLHELIHVFIYEAGLGSVLRDAGENLEEQIANVVSSGFCQVITDNDFIKGENER